MPDKSIEVTELTLAGAIDEQRRPGHLFYHTNWLRLLRQHYGYHFLLTSGPGGEYMLFAKVNGLLGPKLVSLPFSDYTIPQLAPDRVPLHIAALQRLYQNAPILIKAADFYASPHELRFLGKPVAAACLHRVQVTAYPEMYMSASFRRGIKKAQRNNLEVFISTSRNSLHQFYHLFYRLRTEKLGLIPQAFSFFEQVYEQFIQQERGYFFEVRKGEQLLASAVIIRDGNTLYYKWGCSSREHLYMRPNNLLFSELIRHAGNTGCQVLDLGLSDLDETRGLIRFKDNMGGRRSSIYSYSLYPPGFPQALETKLKGMVNQMASIVVQNKLPADRTQSFSQALYPLFV
ncbi:GNAT family N-acetyltransferase [Cesiribacter sp. SM1]|uniref:GNAT family N-acetyltransferase n=1 Tax=Cesiribacter sp. SM1 TaxID=2861196 RepID=UPI001CD60365|nr:GNAT family N-acetyltransferase [Cesiribacter sp. SM1]